MKTASIRKGMLVGIALLIGIGVCVSVWFFLWEHRLRDIPEREHSSGEQQSLFPAGNRLTTENRNALQSTSNPDEEPLERDERVARNAKSNFMSLWSAEELTTPRMQKILGIYDSPEYIEFLKDMRKNGPSTRKWFDFLESQGVPVDREMFKGLFRGKFSTGGPEDYEPEMRVEVAKLFLAAAPVDLTDPEAAANQRREVLREFRLKDERNSVWFLGQFDADWDGALRVERKGMESNPALAWMIDVQRNAAKVAGVDAPETQASASSWDLSSVGESSSASHGETEVPTTLETSARAPMTDAEIEAPIEKSLTPQPPDIPSEIQSKLETTLSAQFSSERFERAMSTLERYGPEEGLRRLRENDPEVAKQVEQYRKREEQDK